MTNSSKSFKRAIFSAARELTHGLRKSALENGWPTEAVRGIGIHHDGEHFKVHTSSAVEDLVWKHEYGDEKSHPTGVIRKYLNDTALLSEVMYRHYVGQDRGH